MENYRIIKKRTGFAVFFISLISFILLYLRISYVFESTLTIYGSYFIQYFLDTLLAALFATAILSGRKVESRGARVLSALKLSLPRLVYLVPYYYLYYMSDGYDSIDSLSLLLLRSAFMLVLFVIELHVYYGVACFFAKRAEGAEWNFYRKAGLFDFSVGAAVGIFAICFTKFIMNIISEGIDIITYLIDYEEFYSTEEVYFMLGKFILAFLSLFISHVILMSLRARFIKKNIEIEE